MDEENIIYMKKGLVGWKQTDDQVEATHQLITIKEYRELTLATLASSVFTITSFKIIDKISRQSVATLSAILITVVVYFILLFAMKIIVKEELMMLPKGEKICRFLGKLGMKSFA